MRRLNLAFMSALGAKGHLAKLADRVRLDPDLDIFIRDENIDIYFKGARLLNLGGPGSQFRVSINPAYCQKLNVPQRLDTPQEVDQFLALLPQLKENIILFGKGAAEAEYEQLFIRSNNWHGHLGVKTNYCIVDRQYTLTGRDSQIDMIGVTWPNGQGRRSNEVHPVLIEFKYSYKSGVNKLHQQLPRYLQYITQNHWQEFYDDLCAMLTQRAELGLFGEDSQRMTTLQVPNNPANLAALAVLVDYNAKSTQLASCQAALLASHPNIRVAHLGLALW